MSIVTMTTTLAIGSVTLGQRGFDASELSAVTGNSADQILGPPRWSMALAGPAKMSLAQAAEWRALLASLRRRVNHFAAWDPLNPAPRGTMRGTLTLSGAHSAGATSLVITGGAGQASTTLLAGDWLQVGTGLTSQLVMVTANATANGSGVITVTFEAPLRTAYSSGASVTWDKALGHYKMVGDGVSFGTADGAFLVSSPTIDLLEQWQ